jgi:hypothetical protein
MMDALHLRGWSVLAAGEPGELPAEWRRREGVRLPAGRWTRAQEVPALAPIGHADRVVVLRAGQRPAEVEFLPGSQGLPTPAEPARPARISLAHGETLLLDARLWLRATDTTSPAVEIWEQS